MDLYLIKSSESKPAKISKLKYLGKLEEEEFELLQKLFVIEDRYDFYKDIQWTEDEAKKKYYKLLEICCIQKNIKAKVSKSFEYFESATKERMGIIGYAD